MAALQEKFDAARAENRAVLIGYLPAGFPDYDGCIEAMAIMVESGVDVVEVGLPYSDPLMDGATIQQAVDIALSGGTATPTVLSTVAAIAATGAPTLVMSYWNPIEKYGVEAFARDLAGSGGVGVITPDLTPEESGPWMRATDSAGIDRVYLVAPSSSDERIAVVAGATTGFVYAASTMGVTGTRTTVGSAAGDLVARTRALTDRPIAVGLGVSTGDQAAEVAAYADGVIVGSAFVRALLDAPSRGAGLDAVAALTVSLAAGVRRR
ncbi:MAG: tryptophan synthase subunit alpha [Actinobacteria bacterium]|nr:tryptophan synthase subunit alpha [Actinomycetota bacterium]